MSGWAIAGQLAGDLLNTGLSTHMANKNLRFQKEAAKNAYRWATADMRAAGLNPMLAATGGLKPASPSGGTSFTPSKLSVIEGQAMANSAKLIKEQSETEKTKQKVNNENAEFLRKKGNLISPGAGIGDTLGGFINNPETFVQGVKDVWEVDKRMAKDAYSKTLEALAKGIDSLEEWGTRIKQDYYNNEPPKKTKGKGYIGGKKGRIYID